MNNASSQPRRLPEWLKVKLPTGENVERLKAASRRRGLATVCEEARCPNLAECWGGGTATFMVMGDECTRGCRFCSVASNARPAAPDPEEPEKLAQTLAEMNLEYVVVTTVCRDDLPDQGAGHLAQCIRTIKAKCPRLKLEMLIQDFRGDMSLVDQVLEAGADVIAHNVECVERLTGKVRDAKAGYRQSLDVLAYVKQSRPNLPTKTSLMLGLGETKNELIKTFSDVRSIGVDILTLGQYLRPTGAGLHLPVERFVPPDEFDSLGEKARAMGFLYVASGPFVRSSYRAAELFMKGHLAKADAI